MIEDIRDGEWYSIYSQADYDAIILAYNYDKVDKKFEELTPGSHYVIKDAERCSRNCCTEYILLFLDKETANYEIRREIISKQREIDALLLLLRA